MRSVLAPLMALVVLTACAPQSPPQPPSTPSPSAPPSPSPSPSPSPTRESHVFLIVMENRSYTEATTGRYIGQLARQYAVATNYHGVRNPSLPNYLAMTSGSTWGITDDGYHQLPAGGIGAQLTAAGISWRAYMEGMSGGCFRSPYPYALKHNPFAYYGGSCPPEVVPFTQFDSDMAGAVPRLVWITPDMCHDGHDCSTAVADAWLSSVVPRILATSAWKDGGLLVITWDESYDITNHILTLVIHPRTVFHSSRQRYDHYSLLATIEDRLGLPRLGLAANASPMEDLVASWPLLRRP